MPIILVGNKCDIEPAIVSTEEGQKMAAGYGISYIETSAMSNINIVEMFDTILNLTYEYKIKNQPAAEPEKKESIKLTAAAQAAPPKRTAENGCAC